MGVNGESGSRKKPGLLQKAWLVDKMVYLTRKNGEMAVLEGKGIVGDQSFCACEKMLIITILPNRPMSH